MKVWKTAACDAARAAALARETGLPPGIAAVLSARGIADAAAADRFLNPRLSEVADPGLIPGVDAAVVRILAALRNRESISVYGDYDVDGVTGSAVLAGVLRRLGGRVSVFLPERLQDGYGFTVPPLLRCLARDEPRLIITVDCGTGSDEAVAEALRRGVEVIVTDHHEPPPRPAPALALVNPHLGAPPALEVLAGVGVAFKVCHALLKQARALGLPGAAALDLREWLDLVAVGTVGDIVPLTGENRILVRHGIARLNASPSLGLKALAAVAGLKGPLTAHHIGYQLAPRLNAAGRLGGAEEALKLLMTDSKSEAEALAKDLDEANQERRTIEDSIRSEAEAELASAFSADQHFGLVSGRDGWHVGTIGIVASRITSRFYRPCVIIGFDEDGRGRGSCRSVQAVDILAVLEECKDLLVTFGGHRMAAGLTIERANLEPFRERFNRQCRVRWDGDSHPSVPIDAWVALSEMDRSFVDTLEKLQPFGHGNPAPVWGVRGVRLAGEARPVGRDGSHLKLSILGSGCRMDAIAFRMGATEIPAEFDLACQVGWNTFRGESSLQLTVQAVRAPLE